MGNTDLNTAWSPISSRRSEGTSFCRNVSYERFCTSMRFGISTIDGILPKSLRLRRPHWIVPAISSPESSRAALASFVFPALERRRCRRHPALWWRPRREPPRAPADYFTCTVAPCSSSFFFISSASALVTFSFTGFGAPSTRSFASLSPSPVSSRTTLMTWIFFSPAAPRMTSNSVFSSVAGALTAVGPTGVADMGATVVTPHCSWSILESWAASSSVSLLSCSAICSTVDIDHSSLSIGRHHSAAFLPRCCRTYTSSRCGAVSTPTSCERIPWIAPTSRARSCSREGRSASALSSAGGSIWPSTYPALIASAWFAFANVWSALATATGSSFENTTPVGPVRCGLSASNRDDWIASRARRFLTTVAAADTARSCLRSSASCWTVRPRYSVSTTVFTPSSRDFSSATASTFSCVGTVGSSALHGFLEQVRDRLRVERHTRAHRRRDGERPEVGALGRRGLRPHDRLDQGHRVRRQVLSWERVLADRRVHVAGLVHAELDLARLCLAHGAGNVEGHGAELRVRHEAARPEHFTEPPDLTHEIGRRDGRVEFHPAALDALHEVLGAHDVGPRLARLTLLLALREDRDAHRFADTVRQHHGAAHHLVRVLGIDAQPERQVDGLVELRRRHALDDLHRLVQRVQLARRHLRRRCVVTLAHDRGHVGLPYTTSMPMLRAVPSTIRIAASIEVVLRSGSFVCAISRTCARVTLPILSLCGTAEALAIPAARFRSTAAGGVFTMNVNERSW